MLSAAEFQERQNFNQEIWQRTVAAVGDQFAPTGFHSRPGLAYMSWSDDTGGLLLPSPTNEVQSQRKIMQQWVRVLKPTSGHHLSTPVASIPTSGN